MTKAAKEINTTVSSISRHNKIISDILGTKLFAKTVNQLGLTRDGGILYQAVRQSLDNLARIAEHLSDIRAQNTVRIFAPRSLMSGWLNMQIKTFLQMRPNYTINVHIRNPQQITSSYIALSYEADTAHSEILCRDEILPLANPGHIDLETDRLVRLICTREDMTDWDDWLDRVPQLKKRKVSRMFIADESAALEAACRGIGLVITRRSIARHALHNDMLSPVGTVVAPRSSFIWCTRPQNRSLSHEESYFWRFLKTASSDMA